MSRRVTTLGLILLAGSLLLGIAAARPGSAPADDPDSGVELLGKPAPAWSFTRWVGPPLSQQKLRGRVVLMRWWNLDCRFCEATLPEIEALRTRYEKDGLVVIGVFHPKPPHPVKNEDVKRAADERGFHGALAIDEQWTTLSRYWLAGHPERNWTSVSFLIDRDGKICWVQGGGEYHHSQDPRHARCDVLASDLEARLAKMFPNHVATPAAAAVP